MTYLGSRASPPAVIDNTGLNPYGDGFWSVTYDTNVLGQGSNDFEIYHLALKGPSTAALQVYVNQTFYEATPRGDLNSWDANHPLYMIGGQELIFYWNTNATPAPKVTIWMRTPQ